MILVVTYVTLYVLIGHCESADPSATLQSVFSDYYEWRLRDAPETASYLNVHDYDDRLTKYGVTQMDLTKTKVDEFLSRLSQINIHPLSPQEHIDMAVLNDSLSAVANAFEWRMYSGLNPINFLDGGQADPGFIVTQARFDTQHDFENFISRLEASPKQINDQMTLMKMAILLQRTNNVNSMTKVPGQIGDMIKDDPSEFILYQPFKSKLDNLTISDTEKENLRQRGLAASQAYIDTLRKFKDFIENDYMKHGRSTFGVLGWNRGKVFYSSCLKYHTTTDITPEQMRDIGLGEVTRISNKMKQGRRGGSDSVQPDPDNIMLRQNFTGTIAEYFIMLSKNPKLHFKTGDGILAKYKDIVYNRIYPTLPRVFKNLPKYRIKVTKMANDAYPAQYQVGSSDGSRAGELQANLHRPNATDSFSMMGLALHEGVPGHHLQFTKQQQSKNLPKFRQEDLMGARYKVPFSFQGYTAYVEGWALYAEYLGEELGLYADDYELMGRYSNEIIRGCRLVIDTGLHYFGWTREEALTYFKQYTAWSDGYLQNEVDRYITWPGQACAYKVGELKIRELRDKAEKTLGSKFDIKDFHELILTTGPVPLSLLENVVNAWISQTAKTGH